MAEHSKIEWTDATWNPIVGCSVVSPGCTNCYAMKDAYRKGFNPKVPQYHGLTRMTKGGAVWTGKVRLHEPALLAPLKRRKPTTYFVNSMGDLFHEDVPDWWVYLTLAVMSLTYDVATVDEQNVITSYRERHVYQVLTKRSARMRAFMAALHKAASGDFDSLLNHPFARASVAISKAVGHPAWMNASLCTWQWVIDGCPGLWLGVSAEDQTRADERIPDLLATPAAIRFVSAEPLLGPIDLREWLDGREEHGMVGNTIGWRPPLDWVIAGGESGPGARPMHPDWARGLRDQCQAAGVPFFFKQWGAWLPLGQSGFTRWQAATKGRGDRLDAGLGFSIGYAFFNDGNGGPETHRIGPVKTDHSVPVVGRRGGHTCAAVGKKAAGARLDGREHRGMPS